MDLCHFLRVYKGIRGTGTDGSPCLTRRKRRKNPTTRMRRDKPVHGTLPYRAFKDFTRNLAYISNQCDDERIATQSVRK